MMDSKHNKKNSIKKLLALTEIIYNKIPSFLRLIFYPAKLVYWLIKVLRLELWIITDDENLRKQKLIIIYAGIKYYEKDKNKNWLINIAFDGSYSENYIGPKWLWQISKSVKELGNNCALMFIEIPRQFRLFYRKKKYFLVPTWIEGEINLSSITSNKSLKHDLSKIRQNKLEFEVTKDLSQLDNFYYNMYLPFASKRWGAMASIFCYDFIKKEFKKGGRYQDLYLVKKEQEYIAGALVGYRKNTSYFHLLGIKDGNLNYIQEGAIRALYCFGISVAKEKGLKRANYGPSRPLLNNSVLAFKKTRGMVITGADKIGFLIKPLSKTEGVKRFFLNNPFIRMNKKDFQGVVFIDSDKSFSEDDFQRIYKEYFMKGISKLFICRFGKENDKMHVTVPAELSDKITMYSEANIF